MEQFFLFCNKRKNILKAIWWDKTGITLEKALKIKLNNPESAERNNRPANKNRCPKSLNSEKRRRIKQNTN